MRAGEQLDRLRDSLFAGERRKRLIDLLKRALIRGVATAYDPSIERRF